MQDIAQRLKARNRCIATAGSFNGWRDPVPLHKPTSTEDWFVSLITAPGLQQVLVGLCYQCISHDYTSKGNLPCLQYKFLVDGDWRTSPCDAIISDGHVRLSLLLLARRLLLFLHKVLHLMFACRVLTIISPL